MDAAAHQWIEDAADLDPGLPTGEAQIALQELTHATLTRLAKAHTGDAEEAPAELASIAFPNKAPPSLWTLRRDLEAIRAEHRQPGLMVQRGELEPVADAKSRLFDEARRLRDGWLRVAENLGLRARLLRDREAFRAAAISWRSPQQRLTELLC